MFNEETLKLLAKVRWNAADLLDQLELGPEEVVASTQLAEKLLMVADEHFMATKAAHPNVRSTYFVAALAKAMAGAQMLAQMHDNKKP